MRKVAYIIMLLAFCVNYSFGQNNVSGPIVQMPVYFDVSPPLRDMVKNLPPKAETSWKDGIIKNRFNVKQRPKALAPGGLTDPNLQTQDGSVLTDTTIVNFDGNTNTQGYYPPDTHGDVGPNHYFQVVNCHYSIYSKTGTLLLGPLDNSTVFTGMPNNSNDGDAVVLYDEQADRWLFSQFSLPNYPNGSFYQMIAVSQTADPTGSWYRYEYSFTNMPDYPKFAVWPDAYYMSMHMFTPGAGNYAGIGAVAYNRTLMLTGAPAATMVMFTKPASDEAFGWLPSDCDGPFPTGNPPNYFLYSFDGTSNDHLGIYEFHVDWVTTANSTYTNFLSLPVNAFTINMTGVTQPGTTVKLDVINDRMMYRLQYRSFSGYSAMVCNHTVDISSTVAGIRWYELRKTTGAWSIFQQGTYSLADNNSRWMGSIAMDSSGNMAMGYSVSGTSLYPSIRYTGRKKNDALNTMTIAERGIFNGSGSQTGSAARWGDYSAMSCDPVAKATYWYTTEYLATTSATGWRTRIASFKFANNPIVTTTDATAITCTGATLNGSVNPNGLATNYHFEYGLTVSYGNNTATLAAGSGNTAINVSAPITGLTAGTTYHYRIVAVNSDGSSNGTDMTFAPCTASVITTAASAITMTTATSGGNVTSDGGATVTARGVCWATTANPTIAGSHTTDGSGTGTFTSSLTGLTSNTTYHVRAYATNSTGTSYGNDLTFTTLCNIYSLPFSESFSTTSMPSCWSQVDIQGGGQVWQFGVITGQTPLPALTGNYAFLNSRAYGTGNTQNVDLVTPVIDMTGFTNITLQYNQYFRSSTGSSGTLSYSINGGSTWTTIQTFTVTSATNPEAFSQVIPALAGQSQVKIKWNYTGTYGRYWGVDDVSITGTASGPTLAVNPANQNVTSAAGTTPFTVTTTSAWTATSNQTWCTVTPSGTGNGTITATYSANGLTTSRVANVTVTVTGLTPVVVTVTQAGIAAPTLAVSPPNQNVTATAGTTPFTVTSNSSWTATSNQTWCTVTPSGTGNGTITATYAQNTLFTSRIANITVTVTGLSPVVVTVTQAGVPLTLAVAPPNQNVSAPAGTTNFTVTSNSTWTVLSDQTWCTVTLSGTGNGTITATYALNTGVASRVANITVTVTGLTPVIVTVSQAGSSPTLAVAPPNQNVTPPAGTTNFTVTSNSSWIVASDQPWCTVTPGGTGNGSIVATYAENTTVYTRVANITVTVSGLSPVVVMVTQSGIVPTLAVTPPNQNVTAPAGATNFTVTTNSSWTTVSNQPWCTPTATGTGNGTIVATYDENLLLTQRVAEVTVLVNGLGPVVVTVTQAGVSPTLFVTPSNQDVTVAAGTTNFSVSTNSSWTAISNSPSWCTVTSSGTGSGTILATYAQNTSQTPRQALVTVSVAGITPVNVTVSQEGLVGIPENLAGKLVIYPNPNKGIFNISTLSHSTLEMTVTITDIQGKEIKTMVCTGKNLYSIDLSGQAKGAYLLRITTGDTTVIRKIIVE